MFSIFINPIIIFSGDRDNIEIILKTLFKNSKPLLKEYPVAYLGLLGVPPHALQAKILGNNKFFNLMAMG